jgi:hypothetical protein
LALDANATKSPRPRAVAKHLAAWTALLAGPIAWAVHLQVAYAMVPWVCSARKHWVMHLVTLGFLAIAAMGGVAAWGVWHKDGRQWPTGEQEGLPATRRMMAALGFMTSLLFFTIIVGQAIATFYINPCED